ncbi:hypothetical protein C5167_048134 [Papaver somniferum]|uniref:Uncharacterized protein n=1 Tax=Papaver somniferum TaxID=3469 RepID=A0A4Y7KKD4_PAPSO|nr:hypothetical protein C5167_048134 [Papaver somniferum]
MLRLGSSNGIGAETARVLAMRGVQIVMAVRNTAAGTAVKETILKETPSARIEVLELDLSSMASVRKFAGEFESLGLPLNILINNAGVMALPYKLSPDGIELQFATNHLGHFLLTDLLLGIMKRTASQSHIEGRIVNVSFQAHELPYEEGIRFDKLNDEQGYCAFGAYAHSKLANILHANELTRRLKEEGVQIIANSLHPGAIVTNLWHNSTYFSRLIFVVQQQPSFSPKQVTLSVGWVSKYVVAPAGKFLGKNVPQEASTTCYVALHPSNKGVSGEYFKDNSISKATAQAKDPELAKKLWDFSMNLIS